MTLPHPAPLRACSVDLTLDLSAPHTARALVHLLLRQWCVTEGDVLDSSALVVSELVTHVLAHADDDGPVTLGVDWSESAVRLWVLDRTAGDTVPRQRSEPPLGMPVVEQLTRRWGVQAWPEGRCLFAELALDDAVHEEPAAGIAIDVR